VENYERVASFSTLQPRFPTNHGPPLYELDFKAVSTSPDSRPRLNIPEPLFSSRETDTMSSRQPRYALAMPLLLPASTGIKMASSSGVKKYFTDVGLALINRSSSTLPLSPHPSPPSRRLALRRRPSCRPVSLSAPDASHTTMISCNARPKPRARAR